jgi:hypothetical protein
MSSISSVNTSSMSEWLERIRANQSTQESQKAGGTPPPGPPPDMQEKIAAALENQGIEGSTLSDLRAKIQDAIDSVTESSDGATDHREALRNAIDGVLEEAGVDMDQFRASMGGPDGSPPAGGMPPGSASDEDDDANQSSDLAAFLQSKGIDFNQFLTSLMEAIQDSDDGNVDLSKVFASAGAGSDIDVLA